MHLLVLGVNHHSAPVEVREKLAFTPKEVKAALGSLPGGVDGAVILSTCNRCEVYALSQDSSLPRDELESFLLHHHHLGREDLTSYLYAYSQEEAMRHLFRVATGVDSMVLGEDQIQGQVRQALDLALVVHSAPRPLSRLFRHALMVVKRARRETGISRYPVSVSHAAVLLVRQLLGDLASRTVLIISAGETGKLTGKIVQESRAGQVLVTNRTFSRAQALAETLGGQALPWAELPRALAEVDIVISSTGAPGFVLKPPQVQEAMAARQGRPLLLIDIAVPRDIDPQVKEIAGVGLYDIDDLQAISRVSLKERQQEAQKVEALVAEEVERARRWWQAQDAVPTIVALKDRAEAIRQQEVGKTLKSLGLPPHGRERMDALTRAIVNKLLHHPLVHLKRDPRYQEVVRELFDLQNDD